MIMAYSKPLKDEETTTKEVALYLKELKECIIKREIQNVLGTPYKLDDIQKRFKWVYEGTTNRHTLGKHRFILDNIERISFTATHYKVVGGELIGEFEYTILNKDVT